MNGTYTQRRRTQMAGGGITQIGKPGGLVEPGIMKYGALDFITDPLKKVGERVRKLIPNELANVATKAAPFVAPLNPGVAGLMRGIGRFDQRGSLSDALKQGLLTTAGGAGARYLGGQRGMEDIMGGGLTGGFTSPISSDSPLRNLSTSKDVKKVKEIDKSKEGIDIVRKGVEKTVGKFPIFKELPPMVQQQLFVGGITAGASALHSLLVGDFREKLPEETMEQYLEARRKRVGIQMRNYMDNYFTFDPEYSALDEAGKDSFVARYNKKQGGRVGLANGSPHFDPPTFSEGVGQLFMSDELGALPKAEGGVRSEDMGILSVDDFNNLEDYRRYINKLKDNQGGGGGMMATLETLGEEAVAKGDINPRTGDPYKTREEWIEAWVKNYKEEDFKYAKGGRVSGYGGGITATMPRIPMGTPRVNAGGIRELDYRATGGFVPVGVKEKADDVPAMLSKNEFVMTADAVKGAGGGSVEKGAQRMYNTMKRLEGRVA